MCSKTKLHGVKLRGSHLALQIADDGTVPLPAAALVRRDVRVERARAVLRAANRHGAGALDIRVGVTVLMKQFLVTRVMIVNYVVARFALHAFADKNCVLLRVDGGIR